MDDVKEREAYIAGDLKREDWHKRRVELRDKPSPELWAETFDKFLMRRLKDRYLEPIQAIQEAGALEGEGFAIVSIQCALIEFLAALKLGKNFKYLVRGERLGEFEYSKSRELFRDFLVTEKPFANCFKTIESAESFYSNVRCALLHEARTKNGWLIWASGNVAVDPQKKRVWRNQLQEAIKEYIRTYGEDLIEQRDLQLAFIRKFSHLADT
ncbi:hypothetical protein SAMN05444141_10998 [Pseudovibrio denitrificans]|uniref:Uncharacterized protein n=1 Tax=Pseudovibrio denitrificans TaxID=258256 RepID=A0A1I7DL20_9HYPH|nr:hypothetical protein [Pseudovibrio denitrificans]SFU12381.1 hypothetical protein SAMN05444141_10998 [Pseudovibrio denitrificans]